MFVYPFVMQIGCRLPIEIAQARSHTFRIDMRASLPRDIASRAQKSEGERTS